MVTPSLFLRFAQENGIVLSEAQVQQVAVLQSQRSKELEDSIRRWGINKKKVKGSHRAVAFAVRADGKKILIPSKKISADPNVVDEIQDAVQMGILSLSSIRSVDKELGVLFERCISLGLRAKTFCKEEE